MRATTNYVSVSIVLMSNIIIIIIICAVSATQTRIFVNTPGTADDVENCDQNIKDVYRDVSMLLVYKMQTWLLVQHYTSDPDSVFTIWSYLGFPADTVVLINNAFTELFYRQRRGLVAIDNLAGAYFYACDIGQMYADDGGAAAAADRVLNVVENFEKIFENLRVDKFVVIDRNEFELVNNLKQSLRSVGELVESWFSTNIPLMKNRMFVAESSNATVKKLQKRFIAEYREKYAESYGKETDVKTVTGNHVEFMGKIIPDVFGFAYNHVELLMELWNHKHVYQSAEMNVTKYSDVVILSFVILINRYFEFKGRVENSFENSHDTMFKLLHFFDPKIAGKIVSKEQIPTTMETIKNYKDVSNEYMRNLMDDSLEKILSFFGIEDVEKWKKNRTTKLEYQNLDGNQLLALMNENTIEAFEFLEILVTNCELKNHF